jgi:hypothetical protein
MISQLKAMEAYISILSIRIGLNSKVADEQTDVVEASETEQND